MKKGKVTESVLRRRDRVFDLVMIDGHDSAEDIAKILLADGSMQSKSVDSATRLVRSDIALLSDVTEQKRYVARRLLALRHFRRIAEDDSEISFEIVTPKGETVTLTKQRWPANARVRALQLFSEEATALARIACVDVTGKRKQGDPKKGARFTGTVAIDLSELPEPERDAIRKAMKSHPGAGEEGKDDDGGAPN
jgi:hypothetical protein